MAKTLKTLKILKGFQTPEPITMPNGKIISQGARIGPGEVDLLQYFSKAAITKLTEGNFIGEPRTNENDGIEYTKNFLEGLISPSRINRLEKLLSEKRFSSSELKILQDKLQTIVSSGIETPMLNLLLSEVVTQRYNIEILNAN